jgi:hypothetical protein
MAAITGRATGDFTGINSNSGGHNRVSQTKTKEKPVREAGRDSENRRAAVNSGPGFRPGMTCHITTWTESRKAVREFNKRVEARYPDSQWIKKDLSRKKKAVTIHK